MTVFELQFLLCVWHETVTEVEEEEEEERNSERKPSLSQAANVYSCFFKVLISNEITANSIHSDISRQIVSHLQCLY